jgi:hypothetical protein
MKVLGYPGWIGLEAFQGNHLANDDMKPLCVKAKDFLAELMDFPEFATFRHGLKRPGFFFGRRGLIEGDQRGEKIALLLVELEAAAEFPDSFGRDVAFSLDDKLKHIRRGKAGFLGKKAMRESPLSGFQVLIQILEKASVIIVEKYVGPFRHVRTSPAKSKNRIHLYT